MRDQLSKMCSLDSMEKDALDNLVSSACEFDAILGQRGDLHLIFTIPDDASTHSRQMAVPTVSKLLIAALDRRRTTSLFSSQALPNVFAIALRGLTAINSYLQLQQALPEMFVPSWIITGHPQINFDANALQYLNVIDELLQAIEKLNTEELVAVYRKFFLHLRQACKKENQRKGKIIYKKLTPPWSRGDVVFRHGHNNAISIQCKHGVLPRKIRLKDRGKRLLGLPFLFTESDTSHQRHGAYDGILRSHCHVGI